MTADAVASFQEWIGRTHAENDHLTSFPVRAMVALLDGDPESIGPGAVLPTGWHWLFFRPTTPRSDLAADGHTRLGVLLPPVPLPRRMWAGGRLRFGGPFRLGESVERVSTIAAVASKQGRTGRLVFVTMRHVLRSASGSVWDEEQDIVYREAAVSGTGTAAVMRLETPVAWSEEYTADAVALFRFSALTFNGHRIHYDRPYAETEGYADLVVHGPLLALLLIGAAERNGAMGPLAGFEYRALSPMFVGQRIMLQGEASRDRTMRLWATDADGRIAMRATASW